MIFFFNSPIIDFTEKINGVPHLKRAYIAIEHHLFNADLEVIGITVYFTKDSMPEVSDKMRNDGNFLRQVVIFKDKEILEGSEVRIRLVKRKRLGVYECELLEE